MSAPTPSSRHCFVMEVDQPEEELNLARATLLVAREEYPQLPIEPYLVRLDLLAEEVLGRLGEETAPTIVLTETIRDLFERRKLRGNRENYYDPKNSFLNDVLDRGLGIPLTLGVVLLEVGWRLGLKMDGVNFPGHFLVSFRGDAIRLLIDPFRGGQILFPDEAQKLLKRQHGMAAHLADSHLKRASKRDILVRLLFNLKGIYHRAGDYVRALAAVERILVVRPTASGQIRDRGYLLAKLNRPDEAVTQLETYLTFAPEAGDADRIEALVDSIRSGKNPLADPQ